MATFKSFRDFKQTGVSDTKAVSLSIKQFEADAKKRASFTAKELGNTLATIPIKYMDLLSKEKDYLINIINIEIIKANENLDENADYDKVINNLKYLEDIRNIFIKNTIKPNDITVAIQKMNLLEANWENSNKYSKKQFALIQKAKQVLLKINNLSIENTTIKELPELLALSELDMSLSVKLIKETFVNLTNGRGKVVIELEPAAINKYKGTLSNLVVSMIEKEISTKFKLDNVGSKLDIYNLSFSPNFVDDVETMLTTAILGKKGRPIKRKNVSKTEQKAARSQKLRAAKTKFKNKRLPRLPTIKDISEGAELPLFSIMKLINEALANQIQDNMGDPNDPPILLRNQTGRFSESAKMLTLTRSKAGALLGTYTYQRSPYDVFLPGNKLGTTKRNPKIYIEGSIRELAIAIMKRKFPGLRLELV